MTHTAMAEHEIVDELADLLTEGKEWLADWELAQREADSQFPDHGREGR